MCEVRLSGALWEPVADSCEHGNKLAGVINGGEFLD